MVVVGIGLDWIGSHWIALDRIQSPANHVLRRYGARAEDFAGKNIPVSTSQCRDEYLTSQT